MKKDKKERVFPLSSTRAIAKKRFAFLILQEQPLLFLILFFGGIFLGEMAHLGFASS